jgi:hypothetical protein
MALNALALQHTMDPETVKTCFLDDDEAKILAGSCPGLLAKLSKARQQTGNVTSSHAMLRHPLASAWRQGRDQPRRFTQFHRNEDRAKINADSGRRMGSISCEHGCLHGVRSQQPHSARAPAAIHLAMGSFGGCTNPLRGIVARGDVNMRQQTLRLS